jgi:hypothetical protein
MELITQFELLAGFAAITAALVNALKVFGVVKDGTAPQWSLAISTLGLVTFISLKLFKPDINIPGLDAGLSEAAEIFTYALGVAAALGLPGLFHGLFKAGSVPLIGKSFSK